MWAPCSKPRNARPIGAGTECSAEHRVLRWVKDALAITEQKLEHGTGNRQCIALEDSSLRQSLQVNMLQPPSTVWHSLGQLNAASEQDPRRMQVDRQSPQSRRLTHSYQCSLCKRLGAEKGIYDLDTKVPERGGAPVALVYVGCWVRTTHAGAPS